MGTGKGMKEEKRWKWREKIVTGEVKVENSAATLKP